MPLQPSLIWPIFNAFLSGTCETIHRDSRNGADDDKPTVSVNRAAKAALCHSPSQIAPPMDRYPNGLRRSWAARTAKLSRAWSRRNAPNFSQRRATLDVHYAEIVLQGRASWPRRVFDMIAVFINNNHNEIWVMTTAIFGVRPIFCTCRRS